MNSVEEICDAAAIINNAKKVVQGNIQELKEKYQENSWVIHYNGNQMSFSNAVWGGWEIIDHTSINESTNKAEIKLLKTLLSINLLKELLNM